MEGVQQADQVEAVGRVAGRVKRLEADAAAEPGLAGSLPGDLDGALVEVIAVDARLRVGAGYQDRGHAVSAADVGDAAAGGEPVGHPGQGRDPLSGQAGGVAGAEEALGALEDSRILFLPWDAGARTE